MRRRSLLHLGEPGDFSFPSRRCCDGWLTLPFSNVSAEIFVVCRDFLAPAHIDPKFLDPRHVFKDLSSVVALAEKGTSAANAQANVFAPEKKRRQREGYEDGNYTLFKEVGVSEFINAEDPVAILGTVNKMSFKTPEEKA